MKLKKLIAYMHSYQDLTIVNCNEAIIVEGTRDEIDIIINAIGDKKVSAIYSDTNYLDKDYITIVLDTKITNKDIIIAVSKYFKTLSATERGEITL